MEPTDAVLRGLLATAPDALLAVESDGTIVYANDQAVQLFGWAREELLGCTVDALVPERFRARHPALRAGYVRQPTVRPMGAGLELWARRKDGSEFPAEVSLSSFDTEDGPLMAAAIRDVTAARRTEQKFRAVLASAPDAIIGVDASGGIELVNAQAERLFGWSAEELVGRPIETLVPDAAHERHRRHRHDYAHDPQVRPMGAGISLSGRRRDGTEFPAEISLSAVVQGEVELVLAAVRDITERIELEKERRARAAQQRQEQSHRLESLGQLAGGVAHDFNNLLGVILNYATLIGRSVTDETVAADLGEIQAAAERGAALTRQLLTFARRDVVHTEPVEVNEVVEGVASMLSRTLGEHVALSLELGPGPLTVMADRHQLEHVLLNLALNARDAMPAGGSLTIRSERHHEPGAAVDTVVLRVCDTGTGMTPDVVARAFEPFFTTKSHSEGSGLGLATVYGIVRRSGGTVQIDSEPGVGTAITIGLPATSLPTAVSHEEGTEHLGGSERVLLVEDEEALRVGTARLLSAHGYDVAVAGDGVEAMELLERLARQGDRVHVVLTDVAMPRMRGDELALRVSERHPGLPLVFMSGHEAATTPLGGPVLAKPVPQHTLLRALREVIDA